MKKAFLALCATAAFAGGVDDLHAPWGQILSKIVKDDRVDYAAAKADLPALDGYIKSLATLDSNVLKASSAAAQKALWINAFNANVVQLIVTNPGTKSIGDIPRWNDSTRFVVAGRPVSLRDIQDSTLLLPTKDARYWFALTNGTLSAAPLGAEPFTGDNLEAKLTERTKKFMSDTLRVKVVGKEAHIQKSFDWLRVKPYFKKAKGGIDLVDFLAKYGPSADWSNLQLKFDINENFAKNAVLPPPAPAVKKGKKK
jgi:Protein of unknown function, DUF547